MFSHLFLNTILVGIHELVADRHELVEPQFEFLHCCLLRAVFIQSLKEPEYGHGAAADSLTYDLLRDTLAVQTTLDDAEQTVPQLPRVQVMTAVGR